jgi:hypothetical protein
VVALLATALVALPANAGESCHKINTSAEGISLTGPTENPVVAGGRTQGGALLQGTTSAVSLVTEFSGFPDLPFTGPLTFTTNRGSVTFTVTGVVSIGIRTRWIQRILERRDGDRLDREVGWRHRQYRRRWCPSSRWELRSSDDW